MGVIDYSKHTTDKIGSHGYMPFYERYLSGIRTQASRVLEIGVGVSIRMWLEFFPNATIVGCDSRPNGAAAGGNSDRWKFVAGKQQDPETIATLCAHGQYDVIIDDAGHDPQQIFPCLEGLWSSLKPGGFYFIEDIGVGFDAGNEHLFGQMLSVMFERARKIGVNSISVEQIQNNCGSSGLFIFEKKSEE